MNSLKTMDLSKEIRLLTLRQPFASLLFAGKTIETRSRETTYRGPVLISASKKPYTWQEVQNICSRDQFEGILEWTKNEGRGHEKYCGHAIGLVNLINCRDMEPGDEQAAMVEYNYELFSWDLLDPKLIIPFPIKGTILFTSIPYEIKKLITLSQPQLTF
jgi:hypothetical protein